MQDPGELSAESPWTSAHDTLKVDGTSGFIRHQQFAVCLALIVDGQVELGVIGCPNLGSKPAALGEEVVPNGDGVMMIAVKGEGSWSVRRFSPLPSLHTSVPPHPLPLHLYAATYPALLLVIVLNPSFPGGPLPADPHCTLASDEVAN